MENDVRRTSSAQLNESADSATSGDRTNTASNTPTRCRPHLLHRLSNRKARDGQNPRASKASFALGKRNDPPRARTACEPPSEEHARTRLIAELDQLKGNGPVLKRTVRDLAKRFDVSKKELASLIDEAELVILSPKQVYRLLRDLADAAGLSRRERRLLAACAFGTFSAAAARALAPLTMRNVQQNFGDAFMSDSAVVVSSEIFKRLIVLPVWTKKLLRIDSGLLEAATKRLLSEMQRLSDGDAYNEIVRGVESAGLLFDDLVAQVIPLVSSVVISEVVTGMLDLRMMLMSLVTFPVTHIAAKRRIKYLQETLESSKAADDRFKQDLETASDGHQVIHTLPGSRRVINAVNRRGFTWRQEKRARERSIIKGSLFDAYLPSNACFMGTVIGGWAIGVPDAKMFAAAQALAAMVFSLQQLLQKLYVELPEHVSNASQILNLAGRSHTGKTRNKPVSIDKLENLDLAISDVSFAYKDGSAVHKGISITIRSGDNVIIKGESGGGKSTLGKLMAGIESATEGSVTVGGVPVSKIEKGFITYVPQFPVFLPGTLLQNLAYYLPHDLVDEAGESIRKDAEALLGQLELDVDLDSTDFASKLSGGQLRRLSLLGPVLQLRKTGRGILLIDEPMSGLDPGATSKVAELLRTLAAAERITLICIEHGTSMDSMGRVLHLSSLTNAA